MSNYEYNEVELSRHGGLVGISSTSTSATSTGQSWSSTGIQITPYSPTSDPPLTTVGSGIYINSPNPEPELTPIQPPKCFECGKEVDTVSSYKQKHTLVVIIKCHNTERRIDISLKRFKGNTDDALEWFSDTFQWVFNEESQWRKVKPDETVSTVHADRKILSDWLEKV